MARALVIGLSGFIAVGKTTFCRIAEHEYGAHLIEFRQFFQSELERRCLAETRENLDTIANDWYARFGRQSLFELLWERACAHQLVVVDSIRTAQASRWFAARSSHSYVSVVITAPLHERINRLRSRDAAEVSESNIAAYDDVMRRDGIETILDTAHHILDNSRSLPEYEAALRRFLELLCRDANL
jgi:dephospho-CoA kinase